MFYKQTEKDYATPVEGVRFKTLVHGERTHMCEFRLEKGSPLTKHSHPHEQTGYLVSGRLDLFIEGDKLEELYAETQQQIRLEVINYYYALEAAYESVQSAQKQVRSAQRAYELIGRKYGEGQSSLLELIDARNSLTSAAANTIIARSEYFSSLADFEYAMGTIDPSNY